MRFHEYFSKQEMEILRQRSERLASDHTAARYVEQAALRIMFGSEQYAVSTSGLVAVYERMSVEPVPCTPPHILGVTNVRGHIIPVLSLAHFLNISSEKTGNHIVVARYRENTLGIAVSQIGDILTYTHEELSPLVGETRHWIKGVLRDGTTLIDLEALLSDSALVVQDSPNS